MKLLVTLVVAFIYISALFCLLCLRLALVSESAAVFMLKRDSTPLEPLPLFCSAYCYAADRIFCGCGAVDIHNIKKLLSCEFHHLVTR